MSCTEIEAEKNYKYALSISTINDLIEDVAGSLSELGRLYYEWNRLDEAIEFYRRSITVLKNCGNLLYESFVHDDLASALLQTNNYSEARIEIEKAFICKQFLSYEAKLWITWNILFEIEKATAYNSESAAYARQQAIHTYLTYRRDGGENHSGSGNFIFAVRQAIYRGNTENIKKVIANALAHPAQKNKNLLYKLQAIIAGERDLALAEDEGLDYDDATELVLLLEGLREAGL